MILVCDKTLSERAISIRDAIFDSGVPCAVSAIDEIPLFRPIDIIVSFADICDDIIKIPSNGEERLLIGDEFVNSALAMKRACNFSHAVLQIKKSLYAIHGITSERENAFGFAFTPALFFAEDFFAINGSIVEATKSEYMIFKYLTMFSDTEERFSADKISKFCFRHDSAKSVPVHIANLNKKVEAVYKERAIRSSRGLGYYAARI